MIFPSAYVSRVTAVRTSEIHRTLTQLTSQKVGFRGQLLLVNTATSRAHPLSNQKGLALSAGNLFSLATLIEFNPHARAK